MRILIIIAKVLFVSFNGIVIMAMILMLDDVADENFVTCLLLGILLPIGLLVFGHYKWGYGDILNYIGRMIGDEE